MIRDPATGRTIEVERRPIIPASIPLARPGDVLKAQAQLNAAKGLGTFVGLYDGDTRLRARVVDGHYGLTWLLDADEAQARGRKWVTYGAKSKQQKTMGLRERPELAPGEVHVAAQGRTVVVRRSGCKWGSDAVLKFNTTDGKES